MQQCYFSLTLLPCSDVLTITFNVIPLFSCLFSQSSRGLSMSHSNEMQEKFENKENCHQHNYYHYSMNQQPITAKASPMLLKLQQLTVPLTEGTRITSPLMVFSLHGHLEITINHEHQQQAGLCLLVAELFVLQTNNRVRCQ
jgi:hypothetical protein